MADRFLIFDEEALKLKLKEFKLTNANITEVLKASTFKGKSGNYVLFELSRGTTKIPISTSPKSIIKKLAPDDSPELRLSIERTSARAEEIKLTNFKIPPRSSTQISSENAKRK